MRYSCVYRLSFTLESVELGGWLGNSMFTSKDMLITISPSSPSPDKETAEMEHTSDPIGHG